MNASRTGTRIGIIACEMLRKEIDLLAEDDPDIVHKEYLHFGLHADPKDLRRTVEEKINALEGRVDVVLLGYGTCRSLHNISHRLRVPIVMLDGDDCIEILLGKEEYAKELKRCAGTWFAIPSIAEKGQEYVVGSLNLDKYEGEYEPSMFVNMVFENYSRCLYINTGVEDREQCKEKSKQFAEQHKLQHEARCGTITNVFIGFNQAKLLAAKILEERAYTPTG